MKFWFRAIRGVGDFIDRFYARGLGISPTCGDAEAEEMRAALQAGNWQAAATALADRPRDWSRRFFLTEVAADLKQEPPWLEAWLDEQPENATAQLVAGAAWTSLAWAARGGGYALTVSNQGALQFFERLHRSRQLLMQAAQSAPADPTPWTFLVRLGRGTGADAETVEGWFKRAVAADPFHYYAHQEWLQYKCAKWCGSNEEMWALAQGVTAAAPVGSAVFSLIPVAHMENVASLAFDDAVTDPDRVKREYWADPRVGITITNAFQRMRSRSAVMSPDRLMALGEFAYGLWKCGARELAAEAFDQIGDRLAGSAWYVGLCPARTFRKARRECRARS